MPNKFLDRYLANTEAAIGGVKDQCAPDIEAAVALLVTCFKGGGTLYLCGNGGSAADCQHLATEFVASGLRAVALTTDTSFITAWSNDLGFNDVFAQQVSVFCKSGDVLLAISTSGKSVNVYTAATSCKIKKGKVIGLTGENKLGDVADVCIRVPSSDTQHCQEAHLAIEHVIWLMVLEAMGT